MSKHQIKVPANLGPLAAINLFPGYLSTGHWALKKEAISNAEVFASEASAKAYFPARYIFRAYPDDSVVEQINQKIVQPQLYTATPYLQDMGGKGIVRFFVNAVSGELAAFDCAHLKLLGLDGNEAGLWGQGPKSAFRDTQEAEDMQRLIMPKLIERAKLTVFQATLKALENVAV